MIMVIYKVQKEEVKRFIKIEQLWSKGLKREKFGSVYFIFIVLFFVVFGGVF